MAELNQSIQVRVTDKAWASMQEVAGRKGLKPSTWARMVIMEALEREGAS